MVEIKDICAIEVLDSRGTPTVQCRVLLSDGAEGIASVPSGASRGKHEAFELRDGVAARYFGKGVSAAVAGVNDRICPALVGMSALDQAEADSVMLALDGTLDKSSLGANAILSVSLALARASSSSLRLPLYKYLGGTLASRLPVPMLNVLNGGAHAGNDLDVQEFMLVPLGAPTFAEALRAAAEVYHALGARLRANGYSAAVGDEGGFAPDLGSDAAAIELLLAAITDCGYVPGRDIGIALDAAASEWYSDGRYLLPKSGAARTSDELCNHFATLASRYPLVSIEDPVADDDLYGWERVSSRFRGTGVTLVGDDLFVTDSERIRRGAERAIASAVLIKPNQIGTLTAACEAVRLATSLGYRTVMSHRSGETEDSFIADLAVALSCPLVKMGAPARAERTAKYNRLLTIESELFAPAFGL